MARIEELETGGAPSDSLMAWNGGLFASERRRIVVYDYVFEEAQKQALSEARELARRTGLVLEVTDLSRQSALRRALSSGLSRTSGRLRLGAKKPSLSGVQERDSVISSPVSRP